MNEAKSPTPSTPGHEDDFDVKAADRERLDWRLGGEQPTERALGRDESLQREINAEMSEAEAEHEAARQRLDERLGGTASQGVEPTE